MWFRNYYLTLAISCLSFPISLVASHFYCTAADERHFTPLVNLIGSIHKNDYENLKEIAVFDLGLLEEQITYLKTIKKLNIYQVENKHPDLLKYFVTASWDRTVRGWFAWKPIIMKQALDMCPTILYVDSGTTILKPLDDLFKHIEQNGYFLVDIGHNIEQRVTKKVLDTIISTRTLAEQEMLLKSDTYMIDGGLQGISSKVFQDYVQPVYQLSSDFSYFEDDGSARFGFGAARHDQTLFTIYAHLAHLKLEPQGWRNLLVDGKEVPFHLHWDPQYINEGTSIYRSRWTTQLDFYSSFIQYRDGK